MNPKRLVLWVIWMALFSSLFIYRIFLGSEAPEKTDIDVFFLSMLIGPLLGSLVVRWLVLPKFDTHEKVLPFFIIGLALSESIVFYGLFLFPYHQDTMLLVSALAVFQYIPIFLKIKEET